MSFLSWGDIFTLPLGGDRIMELKHRHCGSWPSAASCDIIKRMSATLSNHAFRTHGFQTDDPRLAPVHEKVLAGKRLDADDALALYRTGDILAVGWMANSVRERMHG